MSENQLRKEIVEKEKIEINLINNLKTDRLKRYFGDNFDEDDIKKALDNGSKKVEEEVKRSETISKIKETALKYKNGSENVFKAIGEIDSGKLGLSDGQVKNFDKMKGLSAIIAKFSFLLDIPSGMDENDRSAFKEIIVKSITEVVSLIITKIISASLKIFRVPSQIGDVVGASVATFVKGPVEKYISHLYSKIFGEYVSDITFTEATERLYKKRSQLNDNDVDEIAVIDSELEKRKKFEIEFEKKAKKIPFNKETKDYVKEDHFQYELINNSTEKELIDFEKNIEPNYNYSLEPITKRHISLMNDFDFYKLVDRNNNDLEKYIKLKSELGDKDTPEKRLNDENIEESRSLYHYLKKKKKEKEKNILSNINKKLHGIKSTKDRISRIKYNKGILSKRKNKLIIKIEKLKKELPNTFPHLKKNKQAEIDLAEKQLKFINDYLIGKASVIDSKGLLEKKYPHEAKDQRPLRGLKFDGEEEEVKTLLRKKEAFRRYKLQQGKKYNPIDSKKGKPNDLNNPDIHESFDEFLDVEAKRLKNSNILEEQNKSIDRKSKFKEREKKAEEISKYIFYRGSGKKRLSKNQLMHSPELINEYYEEMQAEKEFKKLNKYNYNELDKDFLAYEIERMHGEIDKILKHTQNHINNQKAHNYDKKFKPIKITSRTLIK